MIELGWQPTTMFKDGIKLTLIGIRKNTKWLDECTSGAYLTYYGKMYKNR